MVAGWLLIGRLQRSPDAVEAGEDRPGIGPGIPRRAEDRLRPERSSRVVDLDAAIGDRSDPRNPTLVRMFRMIGVAEEAGSGVPRIRRALRRHGYEAPRFNVGSHAYEFSAELRLVHLLSASDRVWLASLGSELSEDEQVALVTACRVGQIDNRTLRELTGSHRADTTQVLVRLRDSGLFIKLGERRDASYRVSDAAVAKALAADVAGIHASYLEPSELGEQSSMPEGKPAELRGESDNLGEKPAELRGESGNLGEKPAELAQKAGGLWEDLKQVAGPGRRRSVDEYAEIIRELCVRVPLTTRELADLLELNDHYLRTLLKQLVQDGVVTRLYPHAPNHPAQRYQATERATRTNEGEEIR